jgi:predicted GNAT superfamily acetyltransferase
MVLDVIVSDDLRGVGLGATLMDATFQPVLSAGYCRNHAPRWRNRGRPAADVFEAEVLNLGDGRHDFSRLPEQLKVEVT